MSTINDGGPAFPALEAGCTRSDAYGMTLRDYFAAKVCAALLTATSMDNDYPDLDWRRDPNGKTVAERVAGISYRMADAMIKAREAA